MRTSDQFKDVSLPKSWPNHIKMAILHVISLAHAAIIYSRAWAADSRLARVRLACELNMARNEISLLEEEIRIKDSLCQYSAGICISRQIRHLHHC